MSLMDFSSVEKDVMAAPAPRVMSKGEEAEVRIIGVNEGVSDKGEKAGTRWFMPRFDVPRDPMVKEFNAFFWNPLDNSKLDEKSKQKNNYNFQQFCQCFKIDLTKPFSFDDLVGKKGWIIAGVSNNEEYGEQNFISKYVTGQSTANPAGDNY